MFYKSKIISFKGIFVINHNTGNLDKIYGKGPREILVEAGVGLGIEEYLKFDSSMKSFKSLPSVRSFSSAVDGFILKARK